MLNTALIMHYFCFFTDYSQEQAQPWQALCEKHGKLLESRLRPEAANPSGVDEDRLCQAAAARAYADHLMLAAKGRGGGQIRVGDISVENTAACTTQDAKDIVDYFMEQVADLIMAKPSPLLQVPS